jgi:cation transport ATPase
MGGRGSDAALESSDVVLADDRIERLVDAIELSRAARRAIRVNILISIGAALGMAAYVVFRPGVPLSLGVGVHEGSTVLVCLNGLRLLAHRPRRAAGRQAKGLPPSPAEGPSTGGTGVQRSSRPAPSKSLNASML